MLASTATEESKMRKRDPKDRAWTRDAVWCIPRDYNLRTVGKVVQWFLCVRTTYGYVNNRYAISNPSHCASDYPRSPQPAYAAAKMKAMQREDGSGMIMEPTPRQKSRWLTVSKRQDSMFGP